MRINGIVQGVPNVARILNKNLPDEMQKQLAAQVDAEARQMLRMMQDAIPVKTGATKAELTIKKSNRGLSARIGLIKALRGYIGKILNKGAAPHEILPRKASVLSFNGRFAARVNHPGFVARPWISGANAARAAFQAKLRQAMINALKRFGT